MPSSRSLAKKLQPNNCGLLVIDIQNDFCSYNSPLVELGRDVWPMDPMIDRLSAIIERAQAIGVVTLYAQQIYDPTKLTDRQKRQYDRGSKRILCQVGSEGANFYRLRPPPDDVYPKYTFNIFSNPDFVKRLGDSAIDTLIVTGVDTPYCVESAVRAGFDEGYDIVVPKDLVATNGAFWNMHDATLEGVQYMYGEVTTAADIANIWSVTERL